MFQTNNNNMNFPNMMMQQIMMNMINNQNNNMNMNNLFNQNNNMNNIFNQNNNMNNMANQFNNQFNQNYNMFNQNNNQFNQNNNMLNQNNNMFNQFNNMNNMFNQINNMNNANNKKESENNLNKNKPPNERITRSDKLIFEDDSSNSDEIRNIYLQASSGLRVLISISKYKTLPDLFKLYIRRIGISENLIGKEIIFIFNAETLTLNDTRLI